MSVRPIAVLLLSMPLFAACGGLTSRAKPPETYRLVPIKLGPIADPADGVLVVARPVARPGLEGDRLVVTLPDHRVDVYAAARWVGPLPTLTEGLLLDALRARRVAAAVVSERDGFPGAYRLQTEIATFEANYVTVGQPPVVKVVLRGHVGLDTGTRRVLGEVSAEGESHALADRRSAVADAFQAAWAAALEAYVARVAEMLKPTAGSTP